MSPRPRAASGSGAPEQRTEPTGLSLNGKAPATTVHAAAGRQHAYSNRLPRATAQAGSMPRISAPGTFFQPMSGVRFGFATAPPVRNNFDSEAASEGISEMQSCVDEAQPVSAGGSAGDPAAAVAHRAPQQAPHHAQLPKAPLSPHRGPHPQGAPPSALPHPELAAADGSAYSLAGSPGRPAPLPPHPIPGPPPPFAAFPGVPPHPRTSGMHGGAQRPLAVPAGLSLALPPNAAPESLAHAHGNVNMPRARAPPPPRFHDQDAAQQPHRTALQVHGQVAVAHRTHIRARGLGPPAGHPVAMPSAHAHLQHAADVPRHLAESMHMHESYVEPVGGAVRPHMGIQQQLTRSEQQRPPAPMFGAEQPQDSGKDGLMIVIPPSDPISAPHMQGTGMAQDAIPPAIGGPSQEPPDPLPPVVGFKDDIEPPDGHRGGSMIIFAGGAPEPGPEAQSELALAGQHNMHAAGPSQHLHSAQYAQPMQQPAPQQLLQHRMPQHQHSLYRPLPGGAPAAQTDMYRTTGAAAMRQHPMPPPPTPPPVLHAHASIPPYVQTDVARKQVLPSSKAAEAHASEQEADVQQQRRSKLSDAQPQLQQVEHHTSRATEPQAARRADDGAATANGDDKEMQDASDSPAVAPPVAAAAAPAAAEQAAAAPPEQVEAAPAMDDAEGSGAAPEAAPVAAEPSAEASGSKRGGRGRGGRTRGGARGTGRRRSRGRGRRSSDGGNEATAEAPTQPAIEQENQASPVRRVRGRGGRQRGRGRRISTIEIAPEGQDPGPLPGTIQPSQADARPTVVAAPTTEQEVSPSQQPPARVEHTGPESPSKGKEGAKDASTSRGAATEQAKDASASHGAEAPQSHTLTRKKKRTKVKGPLGELGFIAPPDEVDSTESGTRTRRQKETAPTSAQRAPRSRSARSKASSDAKQSAPHQSADVHPAQSSERQDAHRSDQNGAAGTSAPRSASKRVSGTGTDAQVSAGNDGSAKSQKSGSAKKKRPSSAASAKDRPRSGRRKKADRKAEEPAEAEPGAAPDAAAPAAVQAAEEAVPAAEEEAAGNGATAAAAAGASEQDAVVVAHDVQQFETHEAVAALAPEEQQQQQQPASVDMDAQDDAPSEDEVVVGPPVEQELPGTAENNNLSVQEQTKQAFEAAAADQLAPEAPQDVAMAHEEEENLPEAPDAEAPVDTAAPAAAAEVPDNDAEPDTTQAGDQPVSAQAAVPVAGNSAPEPQDVAANKQAAAETGAAPSADEGGDAEMHSPKCPARGKAAERSPGTKGRRGRSAKRGYGRRGGSSTARGKNSQFGSQKRRASREAVQAESSDDDFVGYKANASPSRISSPDYMSDANSESSDEFETDIRARKRSQVRVSGGKQQKDKSTHRQLRRRYVRKSSHTEGTHKEHKKSAAVATPDRPSRKSAVAARAAIAYHAVQHEFEMHAIAAGSSSDEQNGTAAAIAAVEEHEKANRDLHGASCSHQVDSPHACTLQSPRPNSCMHDEPSENLLDAMQNPAYPGMSSGVQLGNGMDDFHHDGENSALVSGSIDRMHRMHNDVGDLGNMYDGVLIHTNSQVEFGEFLAEADCNISQVSPAEEWALPQQQERNATESAIDATAEHSKRPREGHNADAYDDDAKQTQQVSEKQPSASRDESPTRSMHASHASNTRKRPREESDGAAAAAVDESTTLPAVRENGGNVAQPDACAPVDTAPPQAAAAADAEEVFALVDTELAAAAATSAAAAATADPRAPVDTAPQLPPGDNASDARENLQLEASTSHAQPATAAAAPDSAKGAVESGEAQQQEQSELVAAAEPDASVVEPSATDTPQPQTAHAPIVVAEDGSAPCVVIEPSEPDNGVEGVPSTAAPTPAQVPARLPVDVPSDIPTEVSTIHRIPGYPLSIEIPTEVPSQVPAVVPAEVPADVPTEEPTDVPAEVPTDVPTEAHTQVPAAAEVPAGVLADIATEVPADIPASNAPIPTDHQAQGTTAAAIVGPTADSEPLVADIGQTQKASVPEGSHAQTPQAQSAREVAGTVAETWFGATPGSGSPSAMRGTRAVAKRAVAQPAEPAVVLRSKPVAGSSAGEAHVANAERPAEPQDSAMHEANDDDVPVVPVATEASAATKGKQDKGRKHNRFTRLSKNPPSSQPPAKSATSARPGPSKPQQHEQDKEPHPEGTGACRDTAGITAPSGAVSGAATETAQEAVDAEAPSTCQQKRDAPIPLQLRDLAALLSGGVCKPSKAQSAPKQRDAGATAAQNLAELLTGGPATQTDPAGAATPATAAAFPSPPTPSPPLQPPEEVSAHAPIPASTSNHTPPATDLNPETAQQEQHSALPPELPPEAAGGEPSDACAHRERKKNLADVSAKRSLPRPPTRGRTARAPPLPPPPAAVAPVDTAAVAPIAASSAAELQVMEPLPAAAQQPAVVSATNTSEAVASEHAQAADTAVDVIAQHNLTTGDKSKDTAVQQSSKKDTTRRSGGNTIRPRLNFHPNHSQRTLRSRVNDVAAKGGDNEVPEAVPASVAAAAAAPAVEVDVTIQIEGSKESDQGLPKSKVNTPTPLLPRAMPLLPPAAAPIHAEESSPAQKQKKVPASPTDAQKSSKSKASRKVTRAQDRAERAIHAQYANGEATAAASTATAVPAAVESGPSVAPSSGRAAPKVTITPVTGRKRSLADITDVTEGEDNSAAAHAAAAAASAKAKPKPKPTAGATDPAGPSTNDAWSGGPGGGKGGVAATAAAVTPPQITTAYDLTALFTATGNQQHPLRLGTIPPRAAATRIHNKNNPARRVNSADGPAQDQQLNPVRSPPNHPQQNASESPTQETPHQGGPPLNASDQPSGSVPNPGEPLLSRAASQDVSNICNTDTERAGRANDTHSESAAAAAVADFAATLLTAPDPTADNAPLGSCVHAAVHSTRGTHSTSPVADFAATLLTAADPTADHAPLGSYAHGAVHSTSPAQHAAPVATAPTATAANASTVIAVVEAMQVPSESPPHTHTPGPPQPPSAPSEPARARSHISDVQMVGMDNTPQPSSQTRPPAAPAQVEHAQVPPIPHHVTIEEDAVPAPAECDISPPQLPLPQPVTVERERDALQSQDATGEQALQPVQARNQAAAEPKASEPTALPEQLQQVEPLQSQQQPAAVEPMQCTAETGELVEAPVQTQQQVSVPDEPVSAPAAVPQEITQSEAHEAQQAVEAGVPQLELVSAVQPQQQQQQQNEAAVQPQAELSERPRGEQPQSEPLVRQGEQPQGESSVQPQSQSEPSEQLGSIPAVVEQAEPLAPTQQEAAVHQVEEQAVDVQQGGSEQQVDTMGQEQAEPLQQQEVETGVQRTDVEQAEPLPQQEAEPMQEPQAQPVRQQGDVGAAPQQPVDVEQHEPAEIAQQTQSEPVPQLAQHTQHEQTEAVQHAQEEPVQQEQTAPAQKEQEQAVQPEQAKHTDPSGTPSVLTQHKPTSEPQKHSQSIVPHKASQAPSPEAQPAERLSQSLQQKRQKMSFQTASALPPPQQPPLQLNAARWQLHTARMHAASLASQHPVPVAPSPFLPRPPQGMTAAAAAAAAFAAAAAAAGPTAPPPPPPPPLPQDPSPAVDAPPVPPPQAPHSLIARSAQPQVNNASPEAAAPTSSPKPSGNPAHSPAKGATNGTRASTSPLKPPYHPPPSLLHPSVAAAHAAAAVMHARAASKSLADRPLSVERATKRKSQEDANAEGNKEAHKAADPPDARARSGTPVPPSTSASPSPPPPPAPQCTLPSKAVGMAAPTEEPAVQDNATALPAGEHRNATQGELATSPKASANILQNLKKSVSPFKAANCTVMAVHLAEEQQHASYESAIHAANTNGSCEKHANLHKPTAAVETPSHVHAAHAQQENSGQEWYQESAGSPSPGMGLEGINFQGEAVTEVVSNGMQQGTKDNQQDIDLGRQNDAHFAGDEEHQHDPHTKAGTIPGRPVGDDSASCSSGLENSSRPLSHPAAGAAATGFNGAEASIAVPTPPVTQFHGFQRCSTSPSRPCRPPFTGGVVSTGDHMHVDGDQENAGCDNSNTHELHAHPVDVPQHDAEEAVDMHASDACADVQPPEESTLDAPLSAHAMNADVLAAPVATAAVAGDSQPAASRAVAAEPLVPPVATANADTDELAVSPVATTQSREAQPAQLVPSAGVQNEVPVPPAATENASDAQHVPAQGAEYVLPIPPVVPSVATENVAEPRPEAATSQGELQEGVTPPIPPNAELPIHPSDSTPAADSSVHMHASDASASHPEPLPVVKPEPSCTNAPATTPQPRTQPQQKQKQQVPQKNTQANAGDKARRLAAKTRSSLAAKVAVRKAVRSSFGRGMALFVPRGSNVGSAARAKAAGSGSAAARTPEATVAGATTTGSANEAGDGNAAAVQQSKGTISPLPPPPCVPEVGADTSAHQQQQRNGTEALTTTPTVAAPGKDPSGAQHAEQSEKAAEHRVPADTLQSAEPSNEQHTTVSATPERPTESQRGALDVRGLHSQEGIAADAVDHSSPPLSFVPEAPPVSTTPVPAPEQPQSVVAPPSDPPPVPASTAVATAPPAAEHSEQQRPECVDASAPPHAEPTTTSAADVSTPTATAATVLATVAATVAVVHPPIATPPVMTREPHPPIIPEFESPTQPQELLPHTQQVTHTQDVAPVEWLQDRSAPQPQVQDSQASLPQRSRKRKSRWEPVESFLASPKHAAMQSTPTTAAAEVPEVQNKKALVAVPSPEQPPKPVENSQCELAVRTATTRRSSCPAPPVDTQQPPRSLFRPPRDPQQAFPAPNAAVNQHPVSRPVPPHAANVTPSKAAAEDNSATITLSSREGAMSPDAYSPVHCSQASSGHKSREPGDEHNSPDHFAARSRRSTRRRSRRNSETHSANLPASPRDDAHASAEANSNALGMQTRSRSRSRRRLFDCSPEPEQFDTDYVTPTLEPGENHLAASVVNQGTASPAQAPVRRTLKIKYRRRALHGSRAPLTAPSRFATDCPMHASHAFDAQQQHHHSAAGSGAVASPQHFAQPDACTTQRPIDGHYVHHGLHAAARDVDAPMQHGYGAQNVAEGSNEAFVGPPWTFPQNYGMWEVGDHSPRGAVHESVDVSPSNDPIGEMVGFGEDLSPVCASLGPEMYPMHDNGMLRSQSGNMHDENAMESDNVVSNASVAAMRGGMQSYTRSSTHNTSGTGGAGPHALSSDAAAASGAGAHVSDSSIGLHPHPPMHEAHAFVPPGVSPTDAAEFPTMHDNCERGNDRSDVSTARQHMHAYHAPGVRNNAQAHPRAANTQLQARATDSTLCAAPHAAPAPAAAQHAQHTRKHAVRPNRGAFTSPRAAAAPMYSPLEDRGRARSADPGLFRSSAPGAFQGPKVFKSKPIGLKNPPALPLQPRATSFPPPPRPARPPLIDHRSRSMTPTPSSGSRGVPNPSSRQATPVSSGPPNPPCAPNITAATSGAAAADCNGNPSQDPPNSDPRPSQSSRNGVQAPTTTPAEPPSEAPFPVGVAAPTAPMRPHPTQGGAAPASPSPPAAPPTGRPSTSGTNASAGNSAANSTSDSGSEILPNALLPPTAVARRNSGPKAPSSFPKVPEPLKPSSGDGAAQPPSPPAAPPTTIPLPPIKTQPPPAKDAQHDVQEQTQQPSVALAEPKDPQQHVHACAAESSPKSTAAQPKESPTTPVTAQQPAEVQNNIDGTTNMQSQCPSHAHDIASNPQKLPEATPEGTCQAADVENDVEMRDVEMQDVESQDVDMQNVPAEASVMQGSVIQGSSVPKDAEDSQMEQQQSPVVNDKVDQPAVVNDEQPESPAAAKPEPAQSETSTDAAAPADRKGSKTGAVTRAPVRSFARAATMSPSPDEIPLADLAPRRRSKALAKVQQPRRSDKKAKQPAERPQPPVPPQQCAAAASPAAAGTAAAASSAEPEAAAATAAAAAVAALDTDATIPSGEQLDPAPATAAAAAAAVAEPAPEGDAVAAISAAAAPHTAAPDTVAPDIFVPAAPDTVATEPAVEEAIAAEPASDVPAAAASDAAMEPATEATAATEMAPEAAAEMVEDATVQPEAEAAGSEVAAVKAALPAAEVAAVVTETERAPPAPNRTAAAVPSAATEAEVESTAEAATETVAAAAPDADAEGAAPAVEPETVVAPAGDVAMADAPNAPPDDSATNAAKFTTATHVVEADTEPALPLPPVLLLVEPLNTLTNTSLPPPLESPSTCQAPLQPATRNGRASAPMRRTPVASGNPERHSFPAKAPRSSSAPAVCATANPFNPLDTAAPLITLSTPKNCFRDSPGAVQASASLAPLPATLGGHFHTTAAPLGQFPPLTASNASQTPPVAPSPPSAPGTALPPNPPGFFLDPNAPSQPILDSVMHASPHMHGAHALGATTTNATCAAVPTLLQSSTRPTSGGRTVRPSLILSRASASTSSVRQAMHEQHALPDIAAVRPLATAASPLAHLAMFPAATDLLQGTHPPSSVAYLSQLPLCAVATGANNIIGRASGTGALPSIELRASDDAKEFPAMGTLAQELDAARGVAPGGVTQDEDDEKTQSIAHDADAAESPSETVTASPPLPKDVKAGGVGGAAAAAATAAAGEITTTAGRAAAAFAAAATAAAADAADGAPRALPPSSRRHSGTGTVSTDGTAQPLRRQTDRSICDRHRVLFSASGVALKEGQSVAYVENRKTIILKGTVKLAGNPAVNNGNGGILCSHCDDVISVPTFEHHAQRKHNRSAFENTFTICPTGAVLQRLRDIATAAASGHDRAGSATSGHPVHSASLSKGTTPLVATTTISNASAADITERSANVLEAQSARSAAAHRTQGGAKSRSLSAPAASQSAMHAAHALPGERKKRSVPVTNSTAHVQGLPSALEKTHSASGSGKQAKQGRKSTKNKRVGSGRQRATPVATGAESGIGTNGVFLEGGLPLQAMWGLDIEGLAHSDSEEPSAGDGMEEDEEPPVVGGPVADSTFAECVARRQKPPQFVPPVTEMAESTDHGTCMLCFQPDFHPGPDFSERTMIVCDSCEREYHVGCLRECGLSVLDQLPAGEWFCCQTCFKILKEVRAKHVAGKWPVPSKKSDDYTLQVILGRSKSKPTGTRRSMREAIAVLREGFDPIVDEASGRDLAELMVLGQTTEKFDFQNMFSVILRNGSEPVVAAVARVFGPLLVEVPLIATRRSARRQGHARVLLEGLADWLAMHGVDQIMLPAHDDALDTWTHGFGFVKLAESEVETIRQHLRMVMFPGTTLLKLPTIRSQWPAKPERAPVATDVIKDVKQPKRKLQVAAPTKTKKNGRKSVDGATASGSRRSKGGGVSFGWDVHGMHAAHASTADGKSLRPRGNQPRNYADLEEGLEDEEGVGMGGPNGGSNNRKGGRGDRAAAKRDPAKESETVVKTRFGRVAKRPRQADENPDEVLRQREQNAANIKKARKLEVELWNALAILDNLVQSEPQVPQEWRSETTQMHDNSACMDNGSVSVLGKDTATGAPEKGA